MSEKHETTQGRNCDKLKGISHVVNERLSPH